jgi:hypothetical protein
MACAGALEVSNPHPAGRTTAAATQTFLKTFLLFPYYSFSLNILFKKREKVNPCLKVIESRE